MAKKLLIVESPAKAKTIGKYLGGDFVVKSSVGHIRDLPKEGGAIKIVPNGQDSWSFEPTYIISEGKQKVVTELKSATKAASEIYLASDPDREGEAIAWHLREVLEPVAGKKPFKRVTYNEITKSAVMKAVAEPRDIDMPLVDAQQARRILDRLVGYKVSPLLWKNINIANNRTLSAGRVQSVALRLLVERQREIDAFTPEPYYLMGVEAKRPGDDWTFVARLYRYDGEKPEVKSREAADNMLLDLSSAALSVIEVKSQPKTRHALPPFTTSTLQQAASSVLGFSPGKTMKLAQALYEHGRITYMRSDSVNVSEQARAAAKAFIEKWCGKEYYPEKPNFFATKAKGGVQAQEAHEAIRPTDVELSPKFAAEGGMDAAELKLYDLIWRRFVASQMADAKTTVRTALIEARKPTLMHSYVFSASATQVDFEGFLKIMQLSLKKKTKDGDDDEDTDEVARLPELAVGDALDAVRWLSDEKLTKGPTHYSEASLIKALEENGVGRPSTYAATIETLKAREYAKTEKRKLVPLERGKLVCEWLVKEMDELFNVGYTAQMEAELDKVEEQGESMNGMLSAFYAKFIKNLGEIADRVRPDASKFSLVLDLLSNVTEWTPPKKIGKRTYDDKAFYDSCREQFEKEPRKMSVRQLDFLVRMAVMYAAQIPDGTAKMRAAGLAVGAAPVIKADPELVKYCFDIMDRIPDLVKSAFLVSLRDQVERGRGLTMRQFKILAKAIGDAAEVLPDVAEIREKLLPFVDGGFDKDKDDPTVPAIMDLFKTVTQWRPIVRRGKKLYDDQQFLQSLNEQYSNRRALSPRQLNALRRVASAYHDQIPSYDARKAELGLLEPMTRRFPEKKQDAGDDAK